MRIVCDPETLPRSSFLVFPAFTVHMCQLSFIYSESSLLPKGEGNSQGPYAVRPSRFGIPGCLHQPDKLELTISLEQTQYALEIAYNLYRDAGFANKIQGSYGIVKIIDAHFPIGVVSIKHYRDRLSTSYI